MTAKQVEQEMTAVLGNRGIAADGPMTNGSKTFVGMGNGKRVTVSIADGSDPAALADQVTREMAGK